MKRALAIRWERDGKSGYMPAYIPDWDLFKIHKPKVVAVFKK